MCVVKGFEFGYESDGQMDPLFGAVNAKGLGLGLIAEALKKEQVAEQLKSLQSYSAIWLKNEIGLRC